MDRYQTVVSTNLFLLKEGRVLLSRRVNTGYGDGFYNIVGGHLEEDESIMQGAVREAQEEIGIDVDSEHLALAHVMHDNTGSPRVQFYFALEKWSGEVVNKEPDKCDSLEWFRLDDLPENILPVTRRVIENYLNNQIYSELNW